jgi:hypothetical protein
VNDGKDLEGGGRDLFQGTISTEELLFQLLLLLLLVIVVVLVVLLSRDSSVSVMNRLHRLDDRGI